MNEVQAPDSFGYTIFCDDIRHELFGKVTYVGVYQADLIAIGAPPITVQKLCLAMTYFEKMTEGDAPLELIVLLPGDTLETAMKIEIPPRGHPEPTAEQVADDVRAKMSLVLQLAPLVVTQEGAIKVRMRRGDDLCRMGALTIKIMAQDQAVAMGLAPQQQPA